MDENIGLTTEFTHADKNVNKIPQKYSIPVANNQFYLANTRLVTFSDVTIDMDTQLPVGEIPVVEKIQVEEKVPKKCKKITKTKNKQKNESKNVNNTVEFKSRTITTSEQEFQKIVDKELPKPEINSLFFAEKRFYVHLKVAEAALYVPFFLDTGSDITLLPQNFVNNYVKDYATLQKQTDLTGKTATAGALNIAFEMELNFCLDKNVYIKHKCYVSPDVTSPILGQDFLTKSNAVIDYEARRVRLHNIQFSCVPESQTNKSIPVYASQEITILPGTVTKIVSQINAPKVNFHGIVSQNYRLKKAITIASILIAPGSSQNIILPIANETENPIHIAKNCHLADLTAVNLTTLCFNSSKENETNEKESPASCFEIKNTDPSATDKQEPSEKDLEGLLQKLKLTENQFQKYQWVEIVALLRKFYNVFSHNGEIGCINMEPLSIELTSEAPIRIPPYKYGEKDTEIIEEILADLLKKGIIVEGSGEFGSPVVLVKSANKAPRVTFDLRLVNRNAKFTVPTTLPTIDDLLVKARHAKIYSAFDIKRAYYHVPLDKRSSEIMSVCTTRNTYRMNRLPFGFHSAPHIFTKILQDILKPVEQSKLICYLDDICLLDKDIDGLLKTSEVFLNCILQNNILLNPEKSNLFTSSITLLGHNVTPDGISLPISTTERVEQYPPPTNVKKLQSFIGLVNWCAKWVPNYGKIMKPLYDALKRKPFSWTKECQATFEHLKIVICSAPVLMHYSDEKPLVLVTDASQYAWGAVLAHEIEGTHFPIAFHGKCFSQSQINYSIFEKELKALANAVKHFSHLLKAKKFTAMVDNKGVSYLKTLSLKETEHRGRWAKWIADLSEYEFEILPIPTLMNPADALSRMPCTEKKCSLCSTEKPKMLPVPFKFLNTDFLKPIPTVNAACQTPVSMFKVARHTEQPKSNLRLTSPRDYVMQTTQTETEPSVITKIHVEAELIKFTSAEKLAIAQDKIPDMKVIKDVIKNGTYLKAQDLPGLGLEARRLLTLFDRLLLQKNVLSLKVKTPTNDDVILPVIFKEQFLELCKYVHEILLHPGYLKMYEYLRRNYACFGISTFLKEFVRTCETCQLVKPYTQTTKPGMRHLEATFPGSLICVDHMGPLKTSKGYVYILSIIDVFSKYMILVPQKTITATATAKALIDNYIAYFGIPIRLHSDNGSSFVSQVWNALATELCFDHTHSCPYYPKGNSVVESLFSK